MAVLLRSALLSGAAVMGSVLACCASAAEPAPLSYNDDIRPILSDGCFSCHGPDSASRQADLRLDQRDCAVELGAIVAGAPDESELIRRITSTDEYEVMPPPELKKTLTAEQIEILTRWIREGAEYEPHWSLIPPVRPELPPVPDESWVRNPIDRFVAARLSAESLEPRPEADRRQLARRVSLDLTGLPPEPELVDRFVADERPDAYEQLVEELLQSPRWGEHRGRYWLDVARYADTHGIHFDNFREMWSYRDWVIAAFNRNQPFDEFTIENLAGDLLPNATLEQRIGSGFNRCNITTNEGGIIDEEYLVLYARDRTETTSVAWLGLTAGCAVCHDHKFDPLTQREFYALSAFFNNTTQEAKDGNIKDTPPVEMAPLAADRPRYRELLAEQSAAETLLQQRRDEATPEFHDWLAAADVANRDSWLPADGLHLYAPLDEGAETLSYVLDGAPQAATKPEGVAWTDGGLLRKAIALAGSAALGIPDAGDFQRDSAFSAAAWVKLSSADQSGALLARMDNDNDYRGWDLWVENGRVGSHIINRWPDSAIKVIAKQPLAVDRWTHVAISYDGSSTAGGVSVYIDGERQDVDIAADGLKDSIHTAVPLKIGQRHTGQQLPGAALHDVRVYRRALGATDALGLANAERLETLLNQPADQRNPADVDAVYKWWLAAFDEPYRQANATLTKLQDERRRIEARGTVALVMHERDEAAEAYVLMRGEYDQRGERVEPDTPAMLPPFPADLPRNRLGLAQWIVDERNPLTARVAVNRFWQEVFGTGLVASAGDFGVTGQLPSHRELLDWLAVEFRESGWDVKQLFRLMVTSATYRQSAAASPELIDRDPENRLLARGPRYRMDAEMVRDAALATSGLLAPRIGGPSVKPYQPPGVWEAVAITGSNTRDYVRDDGESLYRRSMYTFWKRSAPPASMDIFNAPSRETCTVVRERTNTPLQALATLNDVQFVEAARVLASRAVAEAGDGFDDRVNFIAERLLSRSLTADELAVLRANFDSLREHYQADPEAARQLVSYGESAAGGDLPADELAAWTMTASVVMNTDEFLNK
ncbi:MAG: DUF1553 domain-containing protein [Planctomycetales bacterium]|nr:DUF1553 domain-containing protein [Planctomycetales bacterium]